MKISNVIKNIAVLFLFAAAAARAAIPVSTVDPVNRYSWSANTGWIDWRADGFSSGANFANPQIVSGLIYSPNIGWINLGSGAPADGMAYANTSGADFGVNIIGNADPTYYFLSGLAWSANCGWISFNITDPATRPRIEKATGILRGYAWGANIGWLVLDSPGVVVETGAPQKAAARGGWALYN